MNFSFCSHSSQKKQNFQLLKLQSEGVECLPDSLLLAKESTESIFHHMFT